MQNIKRQVKTFNAVCLGMVNQLITVFGGEPGLLLFRSELKAMKEDPQRFQMPSRMFFEAMQEGTSVGMTVGQLIEKKDARLFTADTKVDLAALNVLALRDKWGQLSAENQELFWDYLVRLAQLCKLPNALQPEVESIMESLKKHDIEMPTENMTPQEIFQTAMKMQEKMGPELLGIAQGLASKGISQSELMNLAQSVVGNLGSEIMRK